MCGNLENRTLEVVMKRTAIVAVVIVGFAATLVAETQAPPVPKPAPAQPLVEVAFVLDTTGSMGGLIAGAKAKIWFIANQIVQGEPTPKVRIALIGYRDKGDEYVTKRFDLTDNIDQVYDDLMKFKASGGGDGPENVNQALYEAVHKLSWSADPKALKIIYLVGDCPPHNEYTDVPTYDKSARAAIEKGVYINTILCGSNGEARRVWQAVASGAEGEFLAIESDGGVREVATPYDDRLARLNTQLLGTAIVYGDADVRGRQTVLNESSIAMSAPAAAGRVSYGAMTETVAANDLLVEVKAKKVDLSTVAVDKLPEPMRAMTPDQRKAHVAANQAQRDKINTQIKTLAEKRNAYIRDHLAKANTKNAKAGFDLEVVRTLRVQAERKGISYK